MSDLQFPGSDAVEVVRSALDEDLGGPDGVDVTTSATIPADQVSTAHVVARAAGVLGGIPVVPLVFDEVARRLGAQQVRTTLQRADGDQLVRGDVVASIEGSTQVVLVGERTMLNIVCRLSGIATHTRRWAEQLEGTGATVLDTRKTTPGLRTLEKYAVRAGGGTNKRMGLYDVAMIKDNHKIAAGSLAKAYAAVRDRYPDVPVQVEVTTTAEALESVGVGARFLLCDNMSVDLLRQTVEAVRATGEDVELEATGGLTLDVAREYALTGVDYLSVGGLTHSSPILDLALDLVDQPRATFRP
ncbi:carboxylating nicotinate-nucleotide diphosphorylase [Pedococcus sp. KACC 23699]|uniref:Nicotinate-nucleotide pyrophosphorylase [carboxylating] n=1 Tax=Pedococcus sp. KACC 23699 TaxID=3149228 RepID=A0AAU7JP63_9MICO